MCWLAGVREAGVREAGVREAGVRDTGYRDQCQLYRFQCLGFKG
jgi:hypothetical protein